MIYFTLIQEQWDNKIKNDFQQIICMSHCPWNIFEKEEKKVKRWIRKGIRIQQMMVRAVALVAGWMTGWLADGGCNFLAVDIRINV